MTAPKDAETPRPWRWSDEFATFDGDPTWSLVGADGYGILSCDLPNSPQAAHPPNAKFIIRAVNSHDALVDALRTLVSLVEMEPEFLDPAETDSYVALQNARAALALAGVES